MGIVIIGIICLALVFFYIARDRSLDDLPDFTQRSTRNNWTSSVKIGIIGDSWASGEKMDQAIKEALSTFGISSEVVSSGHPGAKSRQIYRNLFSEQTQPFSSRKVFMDENLDYLLVLAGVNDTAVHMGREFYAYHVLNIIRAAQRRGIFPVVLEVPEYGIEEVSAAGFFSRAKSVIYRMIFDGMAHNVISDYRAALRSKISHSIRDNMTLVSFDSFVDDYSKNKHLFANPAHLNKDGWRQLGIYIAKEIAETQNERKKSAR
jgi:hypothetical protein